MGRPQSPAGLTIAADRIDEFADRFEDVARQYRAEIFVPYGKVMNYPWRLPDPTGPGTGGIRPHGMGNPAPVFALRGARFNSVRVFGKEQNHLKIALENGLEGIWWRGAQRFPAISQYRKTSRGPGPDMVFHLGWNGFYKKTMLEVMDLGRLFDNNLKLET